VEGMICIDLYVRFIDMVSHFCVSRKGKGKEAKLCFMGDLMMENQGGSFLG
jgi:hypothetical protein